MKFYTLTKIKRKKAVYNMIFGERSNGKTYATLYEGLDKFLNTGGEQLVYLRRWREDTVGRRASKIFKGINESGAVEKLSGGKYTGVHYYSGAFYLCTYDESGKPVYNLETDCLGYTLSLSEVEHDKSTSYPIVTTIIFDEFLTKSLYLPDEFILFMNTVSTIVRQRTNVTIYMLGNTVNKYCPYFEEMGLKHIQKQEQGCIDIYGYGDSKLSVAVEYCSTIKQQKQNNFYFAFDNPKLEMITGGAWELNIYPHAPIKIKPKDIIFSIFIEFNDNLYQGDIVERENMIFLYIHNKTTPIKDISNEIIYSLDFKPQMNYNRNILKPTSKIGKRIKWFFDSYNVFYQNNEVGDSINNYINICKRS